MKSMLTRLLTKGIEGDVTRAALNIGLLISAHPHTLSCVRQLYKARASLFVMKRERVRRLAHPLGVATSKDLASLELRLETLTQEFTALKDDLKDDLKEPLNEAPS